jgi:hypothetical protein
VPRRGVMFPSRAGASGSHHLPWALPRILQVRAKGKRVGDGSNPGVGRGSGVACSKGASNAFIPARRASAIAARTAGRRRGSGRVGRRSSDTGRRLPARRNATSKAGVTGSARKPGKHQIQRRLSRPARVTTTALFWGARLRPAGVLRAIRARAAKSLAAFLFAGLPARAGTG